MTTVLYIIFLLSCIVMIVSVLLQPGKSDAGALFSSSISSTAFGPRGTQSLLAKVTIGAAAVFMLVALALSLPAITGQRSVLQSVAEDETQATPTPQASPVASPAQEGANTSAPANTTNATNTTNTVAPAGATPAPAGSTNTAAPPAPPSK